MSRKRFAPMSFFFVAAGAYIHSVNVNRFLLLNQIKITSFSDYFQQVNLADLQEGSAHTKVTVGK